jgi:pilus assembly protein FimV
MKGIRATAALTALTLTALLPGLTYALGFGDVRLHSTLNAPLRADIGLVAAADELQGLKAGIASRETFARNGLDYPSFLSSATVTVAKAADGSDVLRVQTTDPVTEPFVTMLIEVNYARGRLLREYTVLLDPPVVGSQAVNGPISAPVSGPAASAAVAPPAPTPDATRMSAASGSNYHVQRGDSLSLIAARQLPGVDRAKALVGMYRGNPAAFDGNMNVLHAGAELRLPSEAELAALSPAEANGEVARQYHDWRNAGRLRLVPPADGAARSGAASASAGGGGESAAAESAGLRHQVDDLQKQLAETKRLLELRNDQLAQLQGQGAQNTKPAAATPTAPAVAPAAASTQVPAAAPDVQPAVKPAPVASAKPAAAATLPAAVEPSLLDKILAQWQLLLAALVIVALLAFVLLRRKRSTEHGPRDFDRFGTTGTFGSTGSFEKSAAASQTLPARVLPVETTESILVSESGARPSLRMGAVGSVEGDEDSHGASDARVTLASTGTQPLLVPVGGDDSVPEIHVGDSASALERGDPLAEADFHMAYGLYDQAADLVKKAIAGDPTRREFKLKLLEVYFVWGNKEQFLRLAHELNDSRDAGEGGEWEKIQIMGRQIAADDPMFAGAANLAGAARGSVDLNLEGGQNRVDFNIMGEPAIAAADADEIDLDFGNETEVLPDTTEAPEIAAVGAGEGSVDFVLDDPARGDESGETTSSASLLGAPDSTAETREMTQATRLQPIDSGDTRLELNTAKMPSLNEAELGTIRQKLGGQAALKGAPLVGGDQTAELSIDDLGLDLGTVEVPAATRQQPTIGEHGTVELLLESSGSHGGLDLGSTTQSGELSVTGEATALTEAFDAAATAARPALVMPGDTASQPLLDGAPDADPPTMSEVGTKLDLARAYMDMGDPEGARSILDEVLKEGSTSQRQEAQRLLESLPG